MRALKYCRERTRKKLKLLKNFKYIEAIFLNSIQLLMHTNVHISGKNQIKLFHISIHHKPRWKITCVQKRFNQKLLPHKPRKFFPLPSEISDLNSFIIFFQRRQSEKGERVRHFYLIENCIFHCIMKKSLAVKR